MATIASFRDFLLRHSPFRRRKAPQEYPLLSLPTELLECVLDHTSLPDRIILSQTCRGLHGFLKVECRSGFDQIENDEERMILRNDITQRLPEHMLCIPCRQIHPTAFGLSPFAHN